MGIHDVWLFVLAGVLLNLTPGPDMALIIGRSAQYGTRAGIAAALGVGAGAFFHIAGAAIGLSALILASATAFTVLKWLGALYLLYIGVQMLRATMTPPVAADGQAALPSADLAQVFWQGALTNALNPKVAMFFLAFLPQFVDADAPSKAAAFILLGMIFNVVGTSWNVVVACFAGRMAASTGYGRLKVWLERFIGVVFIGVALKLATSDAQR
ncbi:MAG: LysE family translocator [Hyphomicrobiaceae bacterium]